MWPISFDYDDDDDGAADCDCECEGVGPGIIKCGLPVEIAREVSDTSHKTSNVSHNCSLSITNAHTFCQNPWILTASRTRAASVSVFASSLAYLII